MAWVTLTRHGEWRSMGSQAHEIPFGVGRQGVGGPSEIRASQLFLVLCTALLTPLG